MTSLVDTAEMTVDNVPEQTKDETKRHACDCETVLVVVEPAPSPIGWPSGS